MNNQPLFSSKDKSKKIKCRLLQFLFGALWVKIRFTYAFIDLLFLHKILGNIKLKHTSVGV